MTKYDSCILNKSLIFSIMLFLFFLVNPINAQTYFNPSIGYGGGYGLYGPTSWRTPVADFLAGYGISSYPMGSPYYGQPYYGIPYESPWDPYYSYQGYRYYYADPWIWEGESPPGWQPPPPPWYTPLYSPHDFSFEYLFRPYYGG